MVSMWAICFLFPVSWHQMTGFVGLILLPLGGLRQARTIAASSPLRLPWTRVGDGQRVLRQSGMSMLHHAAHEPYREPTQLERRLDCIRKADSSP
jgi:hypothetical protein